MVPPLSTTTVQDHVALAEIELCGDLMIAASATEAERLSADRIDEVLKVSPGAGRSVGGPAGTAVPRG
ncbi:hypothetical protein ACE14D_06975 [Streptomyces sp. Act-28]